MAFVFLWRTEHTSTLAPERAQFTDKFASKKRLRQYNSKMEVLVKTSIQLEYPCMLSSNMAISNNMRLSLGLP
jgi:hypothetical protein